MTPDSCRHNVIGFCRRLPFMLQAPFYAAKGPSNAIGVPTGNTYLHRRSTYVLHMYIHTD